MEIPEPWHLRVLRSQGWPCICVASGKCLCCRRKVSLLPDRCLGSLLWQNSVPHAIYRKASMTNCIVSRVHCCWCRFKYIVCVPITCLTHTHTQFLYACRIYVRIIWEVWEVCQRWLGFCFWGFLYYKYIGYAQMIHLLLFGIRSSKSMIMFYA